MKKSLLALVGGAAMLGASAQAGEVKVEIHNLSNALYFTPLLVAAHSRYADLFEVGERASKNLQAMAEGGNISGLIEDVASAGGTYDADPAGGLLGPGESARAHVSLYGKSTSRLSIVAMILPTNDGFVGLDSLEIPPRNGTYTYYVPGYDAGTEANDEVITGGGAPGQPGIPADPGGNAGTGGSGATGADYNHRVHIHRGNVGDANPTGGPSDLDKHVHRWLNPIAKIVVKVRGHRHYY